MGEGLGNGGKGQAGGGNPHATDPYWSNPFSQPMINSMRTGGTNAYAPWLGTQSNTGLWYDQAPNQTGTNAAKGQPLPDFWGNQPQPPPWLQVMDAVMLASSGGSDGSSESAGSEGSMGESDSSEGAPGDGSGTSDSTQ